jgi:hypothetical protein
MQRIHRRERGDRGDAKEPREVLCVLCALCGSILFFSDRANGQTAGDSVELFSGQVLRGTVTDASLTITSGLGTLEVPLNQISSLVCEAPPRVEQSLALRDGDVLIGRLQGNTIHLNGDDGKSMGIALSSISRVSPAAVMATSPPATNPSAIATIYGLQGDHLQVAAPDTLRFRSRWGVLNVGTADIRQIVLADGSQVAHRLVLTDGSSLSGILSDESLSLVPLAAPQATLTVQAGELAKIVMTESGRTPRPGPKLEMLGGDVLRGSPQGTVSLQTQYGQTPVAASDIDKLTPQAESGGDITMTMRDGRVLNGAPQEEPITCKLECGETVDVPMAMIAAYARSAAASTDDDQSGGGSAPPANALSDQVQSLLHQMAGNNVQLRQRAQAQLVQMGQPVVAMLNQLQPSQPARVQRQIDAVLERIQSSGPAQ